MRVLLPACLRQPLHLCEDRLAALRSEDRGHLLVPLAANLHHIADPQHAEQPFHVAVPQPDATMRRRPPDRPRNVGAMNSVAFLAESQPARANWIVFACG